MACCRKTNRIAPARQLIFPNPTAPTTTSANVPVADVSELCRRVTEAGDGLDIMFTRGVLVVSHDGVKFELFSALSSQGCWPDWAETLRDKWNRLTPARRDMAVKRLGRTEFTASELLSTLA